MNPTPEQLAAEFCKVIRRWLTAEELDAVNALNAENLRGFDDAVCATGDYCDSNEAMAEAFLTLTGREVDTQDDDEIALWNAAWRIAKRAQFAL